jgi:hypothetical protein
VIFTAYLDESGTHGPNPTVIMAGYVGHAYQWRQFEKKLGRLQARDGFKIFHAKDFKAKTGEFSGWPDEKCQRLVNDLTALVKNELTDGFTIALERDVYLNDYRSPPIPKKLNLDSQYGVCFRACLAHMIDLMGKRQYRDRVHMVIEGGHPNVWDCKRIFDDIKSRLQRVGVDILASFTIENKVDCLPLMTADFLASVHSMIRTEMNSVGADYKDITPAAKGEPSISFIVLRSDALKKLKSNFEKYRQLEIGEWRAKRAAKKALLH